MAMEEGGSKLIAHMSDIQESASDNWIDENAVKVVLHVQISHCSLGYKRSYTPFYFQDVMCKKKRLFSLCSKKSKINLFRTFKMKDRLRSAAI